MTKTVAPANDPGRITKYCLPLTPKNGQSFSTRITGRDESPPNRDTLPEPPAVASWPADLFGDVSVALPTAVESPAFIFHLSSSLPLSPRGPYRKNSLHSALAAMYTVPDLGTYTALPNREDGMFGILDEGRWPKGIRAVRSQAC